MNSRDAINLEKIPQHIAIIMDGNGRWAQEHGEERCFGHQHGVESVRSVIEGAGEVGVGYLTLYAFSTENWNRPKDEIDALMSLLVQSIRAELPGLMKNNVRLLTIGNLDDLPLACREGLEEAKTTTAGNTGLSVVLALSYSGRREIENMTKKVAQAVADRQLLPSQITRDKIIAYLDTCNIPDPDILIRTGGEYRVSNFLLWQIAYTELFFSDKKWPDFRKEDLWHIIADFQMRERRYGKTSAQIQYH